MSKGSGGRLAYERAIRRSSLPPGARHVALTVATWADMESGIIPDRFQPSLNTLAEATGLGKSSIKRNLTVLEEEEWLVRVRPEGDKARTEHARTAYRLQVPEARPTVGLGPEGAMPGAAVDQELGPQRAEAGPTVGHKSPLNSLSAGNTSLSSSDRSLPAAVPGERETEAAPGKATAAQRAVRSSGVVSAAEEQAFIDWCTAKFDIKGPGWWRTCAADIPEHAETWRASHASRSSPASGLPTWCEKCGDQNPAARTNPRFRTVRLLDEKIICPDCHPDAASAA